MRLNKKGMTIIEIIVAIVLISIVLVLLSIMLLDVKDINESSRVNSTYLINKALLTKIIESDMLKHDSIKISGCTINDDIYDNYDSEKNSLDSKYQFNECLKITYDTDDFALLGLYYLKSQNSYVINYIHGSVERKIYDLKEFDKYNVKNDGNLRSEDLKMNVSLSGVKYKFDSLVDYTSVDDEALTINIPMLGNDGKDYTIVVSYFGKVLIEG